MMEKLTLTFQVYYNIIILLHVYLLYYYIIILLYNYIIILLYYYINNYIYLLLLYYYIVILLYYYIIILLLLYIIIWLALQVGKMKQILCSDWLPEGARCAILSTWDYPLCSHNNKILWFNLLTL